LLARFFEPRSEYSLIDCMELNWEVIAWITLARCLNFYLTYATDISSETECCMLRTV